MTKTKKAAPARNNTSDRPAKRINRRDNITLWISVLAIATLGYFCLFSVTVANTGSMWKNQLLYLVAGLFCAFIASRIDYSFYYQFRLDKLVLVVGSALMLVCLIQNHANEIKRVLDLGFISFEPSEFLKLGVILFIAYYSYKHKDDLQKTGLSETPNVDFSNKKRIFRRFEGICTVISAKFLHLGHIINNRLLFFFPGISADGDDYIDDSFYYHFILAAGMIIPVAMIVYSSHLSATVIYLTVAMYMLLRSNAKPKYLAVGFILGVLGLIAILLIGSHNYQIRRILDFSLLPEDDSQSLSALYAIAGGGLTGKGFLNSAEKFGYLAACHNDFIFSIFAEELGIIGCIIMILCFALLVMSLYKTGKRAKDEYASLSVRGIAIMIAVQVICHIAVNLSLFPNTGITLPFFSSGGTALVLTCMEMGYALSVARGTRRPGLVKQGW